MRNVFTDGYNVLIWEDTNDCPIEYLGQDIYELIGLAFHYLQQVDGALELNGVQIFATSMAQTCGNAVAPCDYVRLGYGGNAAFEKLSELILKVEAEAQINEIKRPRPNVD